MWALTVLRESSQQVAFELFFSFFQRLNSLWINQKLISFPLTQIVVCKIQILWAWSESQKVNPKNLKLGFVVMGKPSAQRNTLKTRPLHPFKSVTQVEWSVLVSFGKGDRRQTAATVLIPSDTSPYPFFRPSRWPKDRWLVFHSATIFLWARKCISRNILWICTCLTFWAQCSN